MDQSLNERNKEEQVKIFFFPVTSLCILSLWSLILSLDNVERCHRKEENFHLFFFITFIERMVHKNLYRGLYVPPLIPPSPVGIF